MIIINIIHFLITGVIIIFPFLKNRKYNKIKLFFHLLFIPIVWIHWILKFDNCFILMLDNYFSNEDPLRGNSFLSLIGKPIFSIGYKSNVYLKMFLFIITITLWIKILYYFCKNNFEEFKILFNKVKLKRQINKVRIYFRNKYNIAFVSIFIFLLILFMIYTFINIFKIIKQNKILYKKSKGLIQ
jgi:hypothetical protein